MPGYPALGYGTHYSDAMVAVDVSDIVYQITPEDTPLYNKMPDKTASGVWHEWSQRALTTRQANAQPEGFTYSFTTGMNTPTRLGNVLQILQKDVRVSETEQAVTHYAIDDEFGDQMALRMIEFKTDHEHAFFCATLNTGAASTTNRQMQGLIPAATSAITCYTYGSGAATLGETSFNDIVNFGWDIGAYYKDIYVGGFMKRKISAFDGSATKYIASEDKRVVNTVQEYDSDFFTLNIHLSRDVANVGAGAISTGYGILFVDHSMLAKAWLRRPMAKRVPETADSMDGVIKSEVTLEYGHPLGHYYLGGYIA